MRRSSDPRDPGFLDQDDPKFYPVVVRLNGVQVHAPHTFDTDAGFVRYYRGQLGNRGFFEVFCDRLGDPIIDEGHGIVTVTPILEVSSAYLS